MQSPGDMLGRVFKPLSDRESVPPLDSTNFTAETQRYAVLLDEMERQLYSVEAFMQDLRAATESRLRAAGPAAISQFLDGLLSSFRKTLGKVGHEIAEYQQAIAPMRESPVWYQATNVPQHVAHLKRSMQLLLDRQSALSDAITNFAQLRESIGDAALEEVKQRIATSGASADMLGTKTTAGQAFAVFYKLPEGVPLPQVLPSADGHIAFVWYNEGDRVQLSVEPDGHLVWYGRFNGVYEAGGDEVWEGLLPPPAEAMLRKLQG